MFVQAKVQFAFLSLFSNLWGCFKTPIDSGIGTLQDWQFSLAHCTMIQHMCYTHIEIYIYCLKIKEEISRGLQNIQGYSQQFNRQINICSCSTFIRCYFHQNFIVWKIARVQPKVKQAFAAHKSVLMCILQNGSIIVLPFCEYTSLTLLKYCRYGLLEDR